MGGGGGGRGGGGGGGEGGGEGEGGVESGSRGGFHVYVVDHVVQCCTLVMHDTHSLHQ